MTSYTNRLNHAVLSQLIHLAISGTTQSYKDFALAVNANFEIDERVPVSGSQLGQTLGPALDFSNVYFTDRRLPLLASLVVRGSGQDIGLPGAGFWKWLAEHKGLPDMSGCRNTRATVHATLVEEARDFWQPVTLPVHNTRQQVTSYDQAMKIINDGGSLELCLNPDIELYETCTNESLKGWLTREGEMDIHELITHDRLFIPACACP